MGYHELMDALSAQGRAVFDAIQRIGEATGYDPSSPTVESEFLPLLETLSERDRTIVLELQLHVAEAYLAMADVVAEGGGCDPDEFFGVEWGGAGVSLRLRMSKADENGRRRDRRRNRRRRSTTARVRLLDRMNTWKAFLIVLALFLIINGFLFFYLR